MRAACTVCDLSVTACSLGTSANAAYQMSGHVLVMDASGGKMKDNISGGTFPVHTNTYHWSIPNELFLNSMAFMIHCWLNIHDMPFIMVILSPARIGCVFIPRS